MKKKFILTRLNYLNAPKSICNHIIGKDHSMGHQMIVGGLIMICGVTLVKGAMMIESTIVHLLGDVVGYFIHGVGAIPFIKHLEKGGDDEQ